jgi:hypothetical protein
MSQEEPKNQKVFKFEIGDNALWAIFWIGIFILTFFNKC